MSLTFAAFAVLLGLIGLTTRGYKGSTPRDQ